MANENGKDVANSLNEYSNAINKGTNLVLDNANQITKWREEQINKWYEKEINKMAESETTSSRLETNIDNSITENIESTKEKNKLQTKIDDYTEIQTNNKNGITTNQNTGKLKTINTNETLEDVVKKQNEIKNLHSKKIKINTKIATAIKGAKVINNSANRFIRTGKALNTATNEGGLKSFEKSSSRIMTKPVKKVTEKITSKATNIVKKAGTKATKKVVKGTTNIIIKSTKIAMKIVADTVSLIMSMLPSIAPIIIIIVIIAAIGSFFNFKTTNEADNVNFDEISTMIIVIDDENLQAIYNEYLKNIGKPYLMDHSNLSYDTCMKYYDCSSWVIHCLAHTGIKTIPNTRSKWII